MLLIGQALERFCESTDPHDDCFRFHDVEVQRDGSDVYDGYEQVITFNTDSNDGLALKCQGAFGRFSCRLFNGSDDTGVQVEMDDAPSNVRYATESRERFLAQRASDNKKIGFPAYGFASEVAKDPVLQTMDQQDCIVVVIYDIKRRSALLAHLLTSSDDYEHPYLPEDVPCSLDDIKDEGAGFTCAKRYYPAETYIPFFKEEYFKDTPSEDLKITIVTTQKTPKQALNSVLAALRKEFGSQQITHDRHDTNIGSDHYRLLGTSVDSRTGEVVNFIHSIFKWQ